MSVSAVMPACLLPGKSNFRRWYIHPAILQVFALVPMLWWFCKRLNDGSDEPLGLLTFALAAGLAWRDRKSLQATTAARISGAALILVSVVGLHGLPPMLRAMLAVSGIVLSYGLHRRPGVAGLMLLSLPVVASMQFFLGYPMRFAAAEGTVRLLELCGLVVSRAGVQIELDGHVIGVDPACGGVRMLWHALAAAMALAAIHRLTWRATILGSLLAAALVIPANVGRAALLALKETGHLTGSFPGHEGIGLISFAVILVPLWWVLSTRKRQVFAIQSTAARSKVEMSMLALAVVLAPLVALGTPRIPDGPLVDTGESIFTFNGLTLPLQPLQLTDTEVAFAKSFPGTLGSYRRGNEQIILRKVTSATRRLHPSRDCLRAAGFLTTESFTVTLGDGTCWSRFQATRNGERLTVHERITSPQNGASWTDVSAWYWSALMKPLNGPWQAETVISE